MQGAFLEYAYSVIYSRALPDARDGLKPVQRRILFAMSEMGLRPDRAHVKSSRVVGEVMGKFHPHGDAAIYDALVRMAQPFSLRLPLVDGHGNFGSLDDGPAAPRYTEARPAAAALLMTTGLDEATVDFVPTYDDAHVQPEVLPSALPNLLVNGASGIAVGMATNMAPHNLVEVIGAARHLIAHPDATLDDLMRFVPGPDLPTGRPDRWPGRDPGGLRHRPRHLPDPGHDPDRVRLGPAQGHRRHRAALHGRAREGDREDQGPGPVQEAPGHRRPQGPDRPQPRPAAGRRGQERLQPGRDPRAALPADADGGLLRHQQRRAGRRPAPHARPARAAGGLRRLPDRRRAPSLAAPADQARGPPAPGRGPADRDRRHRRGHPGHPQQRRRGGRPGTPDGRLRAQRGAGDVHPGPAAAPADQVLAARAGDREGPAAAPRSRSSARSSTRSRCCASSSRPSWPMSPRPTARPVVRSCWSRPGHRPPPPCRWRSRDDPCWVLLSSTGLLARTSSPEPLATGGDRQSHDVVTSVVAATARGDIGLVTSRGRVLRLSVLELPALPPTSGPPSLSGGAPLGAFVDLPPGEAVLALTTLAAELPGAGARHRPGRRQTRPARPPDQPRRVGGHRPARRRHRGRRGRAGHRRGGPGLHLLGRTAAALLGRLGATPGPGSGWHGRHQARRWAAGGRLQRTGPGSSTASS